MAFDSRRFIYHILDIQLWIICWLHDQFFKMKLNEPQFPLLQNGFPSTPRSVSARVARTVSPIRSPRNTKLRSSSPAIFPTSRMSNISPERVHRTSPEGRDIHSSLINRTSSEWREFPGSLSNQTSPKQRWKNTALKVLSGVVNDQVESGGPKEKIAIKRSKPIETKRTEIDSGFTRQRSASLVTSLSLFNGPKSGYQELTNNKGPNVGPLIRRKSLTWADIDAPAAPSPDVSVSTTVHPLGMEPGSPGSVSIHYKTMKRPSLPAILGVAGLQTNRDKDDYDKRDEKEGLKEEPVRVNTKRVFSMMSVEARRALLGEYEDLADGGPSPSLSGENTENSEEVETNRNSEQEEAENETALAIKFEKALKRLETRRSFSIPRVKFAE